MSRIANSCVGQADIIKCEQWHRSNENKKSLFETNTYLFLLGLQ